jgi:hypothetical protein
MQKTLSFLVIFAFLFSSVFTTGCFDSKNGIFSTRALGFFGLALVVAATGGSGAPVAFAANVRGVASSSVATSTLSLDANKVKVKIYDYTGNSKGTEPLVEAVPEFDDSASDPASHTFVLKTTAEDETKLTGKKQLLIEVEATKDGRTEVIMSAIHHTNKFVDLHNVRVDFASTALKYGYEEWVKLGKGTEFAQFKVNVDTLPTKTISDLAKDIETNTKNWLDASGPQPLATPTALGAIASAGNAPFCRVYCDAIPGTEKDGDFEFVDVRKYFEIRATDVNATDESSKTYGPFEIYSDATFDFYLEAGKTYTFSVAPKAGEEIEDIFGKKVEKTKESKAIEIDADETEMKLVADHFKSY